jgi:predicted nucleic-acid-binding protein
MSEHSEFIYYDMFKDPLKLLNMEPKLFKDIKDNCVFVLDTNVLLIPYSTSSHSLTEITSVFETLIKQSRLIIPEQVLREFIKNRPNKILEIHKQLNDQKSKAVKVNTNIASIFRENKQFTDLLEIQTKLNEQIKKYHDKISEISDLVKETWFQKDPVIESYRGLFVSSVLSGISIDDKTKPQILNEIKKRFTHKIPPGYKDSSKPDKGIGDYIIWETIKQVGATLGKDVVFVTGDEKSDWFYRSENKALSPRIELLNEFHDYTSSRNFCIIDFPSFLREFKASEQTIDEVKRSRVWEETNEFLVSRQAVFEWLRVNRAAIEILEEFGPIMYLAETESGKKIAFEIIVATEHDENPVDVSPQQIESKVALFAFRPDGLVDESIIFIVTPFLIEDISQQFLIGSFMNILKAGVRRMRGHEKVSFVFASITADGKLHEY